MKKGILFDLDGTLWDSAEGVTASWNEALAEMGRPERVTLGIIHGLMGKTMDDWAVAVLPDLPLAEAREITEVMEQKENEEIRTPGTDLYPFVRETFELLSHDYDLFILSNCGKGYIEAVMAYAGIEEYVKGHICFGDNGLDKPDNLKKMVEDYQLEYPVYVGDTLRDQECCEIAGIPFIFVSWGFGDVPDALYRCNDMKDLPEVIRSLG